MTARELMVADLGFTRLPDGTIRIRILTIGDRLTDRGIRIPADKWATLVDHLAAP